MKDAAAYARKFSALLKRLKQRYRFEPPQPPDPITQIVIGFLEWEADTKQAQQAQQRIDALLVDHNDLRVSHTHEVVGLLGSRYPRVEERAARLLDVLQDIYVREHAMSMRSLESKSKKEIRSYLDTLPGMTQYVAAQVTLLCYGGHAIPMDEKLAELLRSQGVVEEHASVDEIAAFLERHVRAGQGVEVHVLLRKWVDAGTSRIRAAGAKSASRGAASKGAARKKTSRKTKKKKAARKKR